MFLRWGKKNYKSRTVINLCILNIKHIDRNMIRTAMISLSPWKTQNQEGYVLGKEL